MVSQIAVDSKTQIKEILYYISVVCIPCLYKNEVIWFKIDDCEDVDAVPFSLVTSYDVL